MTFFLGLCSIFFINKMAEQNFISENALTAQLISSSNDNLIKHEINQIQQALNNENSISFIENYFEQFQIEMNRQIFAFEENGKNYEG